MKWEESSQPQQSVVVLAEDVVTAAGRLLTARGAGMERHRGKDRRWIRGGLGGCVDREQTAHSVLSSRTGNKHHERIERVQSNKHHERIERVQSNTDRIIILQGRLCAWK